MKTRTTWIVILVGACAAIVLLALGWSGDSAGRRRAEAHYRRAVIHAEKGEYDAAIRAYTKAVEANPDMADAYSGRAFAHFRKGDYDKAWADVKACQALGGKLRGGFRDRLRRASGRQE